MASSHERARNSTGLAGKLAGILPRDYRFGIYHLSTPPAKTEALCHPPPDQRPDKTYCENHFLAVTVDPDSKATATTADTERKSVLVLALEIYIFTTAYATIFFVAKADSTGYLHLLDLPKGTPSPIREVSAAFLSYLVEHRQRKGIQTTVNLFARAQSQYLFPGSVENSGKHVLDDRGLIKWWCRILNPLLEEHRQGHKCCWESVKGYLLVPGLEHHETRAFIPRTPHSTANWILGHPLEKISHYCQEYDWVPPRCLIPKFPDDPKSRYRDELDEEASTKEQDSGAWRSVKSLEQFWEMMAFRQECSSGRMTGFIWVVFDPASPNMTRGHGLEAAAADVDDVLPAAPSTPRDTAADEVQPSPKKSFGSLAGTTSPARLERREKSRKKKNKDKALRGIIMPRKPRVKTSKRNYLLKGPVSTAYYYWPLEGRGQMVVEESDYKRCTELLLRLDFATLTKAVASTQRWLYEVGRASDWGVEVTGQMATPTTPAVGSAAGVVHNLAGLVRKKPSSTEPARGENGAATTGGVNVLGAGSIKKKRKDDQGSVKEEPGVTVLDTGLVRKKPKLE